MLQLKGNKTFIYAKIWLKFEHNPLSKKNPVRKKNRILCGSIYRNAENRQIYKSRKRIISYLGVIAKINLVNKIRESTGKMSGVIMPKTRCFA